MTGYVKNNLKIITSLCLLRSLITNINVNQNMQRK